MFEVIPCVDIRKGRAVRLLEGDPGKETVYFESPVEAARHWVDSGARWLHLVDLDAALGAGDNRGIVREIAQSLDVNIELGGGVRSVGTALRWLEDVDRVVLGTLAVKSPERLDELLRQADPSQVVVSIDAKDGLAAVKGWAEVSEVRAVDLAKRVEAQGIRHVIYTDVTRDGTLKGVNPDPVKAMRAAFPHTLIGGGGVAKDEDLVLYERLGLEGAIVGRALYEGTVSYPYKP